MHIAIIVIMTLYCRKLHAVLELISVMCDITCPLLRCTRALHFYYFHPITIHVDVLNGDDIDNQGSVYL